MNGKFSKKKFNESEIEYLLKQNSIENLGKHDSEYASSFEKSAISLGNTMNRFGKFLAPSIQCSLMDLENYLNRLNRYLISGHFEEKDRKKYVLETAKQIAIELKNLDDSGLSWMDKI